MPGPDPTYFARLPCFALSNSFSLDTIDIAYRITRECYHKAMVLASRNGCSSAQTALRRKGRLDRVRGFKQTLEPPQRLGLALCPQAWRQKDPLAILPN